ncbi:MAG TPA: amino acid adenylation domain-containing protein [Ktedonobacteraceae bacterium]|nr:amino acid adenylation domain-containing protein [Ktedonobacteraceae bacterium]
MAEQKNDELARTITTFDLAEQEAYWLKTLYGDLPALDGLLDRARPSMQSFLHANETIVLDSMRSAHVQELCRQKNIQRYTLLLTALTVVLARHTAQKSLIIGTLSPDSLRIIDGQSAHFANPVALRLDIASDPTVGELLQQVAHTLAKAAEHRDYPFDSLIEHIADPSDYSRAPIFQTMLIDEHSGLSTTPVSHDHMQTVQDVMARCDFVLLVHESQGTLHIQCTYDLSLFDAATIRCLLEHFCTALESLGEDPGRKLSEIQILSEAERQRTVVEWNLTQVSYAQNAGIHTFFEEQARRTPDADAVVCGNDRRTYGFLNEAASHLARQLQQKGVGPDTLVGLFVERSIDMVIGLLAILKAGGAYVPFDPALPAQRLALLLEDTQISCILTQPHLASLLPESNAELIPIDGTARGVGDSEDSISGVSSKDIACILYTSGSTGRPKGVMLTHNVLTNLISWHRATLLTGARTLQFASLGFDQSLHEMFAAWSSGGTLFILPEALRADVIGLADYLIEHQIEKVWLPVVLLQQLAEVYRTETRLPDSLKEVIATGEQLRITQPLRDMFARLPGCVLENHYGPTESHLATTYRLAKDPSSWSVLPPIGRPIANTSIYLVDESLQPVPIGVPGELCISGQCLARGYWNRPELTASGFIPNPYATEVDASTSRMYRTGDLARYLPNGNIEYLGRLDRQIKIRGIRVEPGEIEAILAEYTGIHEAIVLLHPGTSDMARLVAYVVPEKEAMPAASELRQFLEWRLPTYMVPSAFIMLDKLPLNHNGKIDRSALLEIEVTSVAHESIFSEPQTPLEEQLVAIWSELLRVKPIGIHDNFFALGGHSLLGAQLISLMRKQLQVELTHFELFENPTIAGLAEAIENIRLAAHLGQVSPDEGEQSREEIEM